MPATILLVDDHDAFRANARRALESAGFDVIGVAVDGEGGLRAARELAPDLVLLDVGLPDISGLEVARRLHDTDPSLRVVLISTHDSGDYAELARRHGALGFITKEELSGDALAHLMALG